MYADFESAIDDKNRHKPIMFSSLAVSRIPDIDTQLKVFHAPHEEESDLCPFMEYLVRFQENVKKYLFDGFPLKNTPEIERLSIYICVSILSQETGERQSETSRTCGR